MKGGEGERQGASLAGLGCSTSGIVRGCERPPWRSALTRDRAKIELSRSDEAGNYRERGAQPSEVFAPRNFDAAERFEVRILDLDVEEEEARAA